MSVTLNPFTGKFDFTGDQDLTPYAKLDGSNSLGVTVTRTGGYISSLALSNGRTLTVNRTSGLISSITDGTTTWTATRDVNGYVTTWGRT